MPMPPAWAYYFQKCVMKRYFLLLQSLLYLNANANLKDTLSPDRQRMEYIDPTIGNVGTLLEPTRPTTHLPNQVIRVYPIRKDYLDDQISSFPLTAVSHRLGEVFSLKPYGKPIGETSWDERMPY